MKILVARTWRTYGDKPVETYATSIVRVLREKGYEVIDSPKAPRKSYDGIDLVLDLDCGRNDDGKLYWMVQEGRLPVKSAVMFIDSHGYPEMHQKLAKKYDHVFFAVWDKRDLFTGHPSAHWSPNFTDMKWFDGEVMPKVGLYCKDFGFFGSKGGLDRADKMKEFAEKHRWTYDIREVSRQNKHRWPFTAEAMANCKNLFNAGQKHDGPNLRVMESMLMKRPLITDSDKSRSGLTKLFTPWKHYIPYDDYINWGGLEDAMIWTMRNPDEAKKIAEEAYIEVRTNHLVENRVSQVLEVVNAS